MTTTSCTSTSLARAVHRRRLVAAVLALPLSLAMTGTALAVGSSDRGPAESASVRVAADAAPGKAADKASDKADDNEKAAEAKAEVAAAKAEERKDEAKPEPKAAAKSESKSESKSEGKSEAAPAKAADKAPEKSEARSEAKSEAAPAKAAHPSNGAQHGPATSGPLTQKQPLSNADKNGTGANPGETCTHAYCSTRNGSASGNGKGDGVAAGKPCAGCVGKADNKNPKGQAPNGSDHNAGYECDRNQGIGKTNPAHTGCTGSTAEPTTKPTKSPKPDKSSKPDKSPKPSKSPKPDKDPKPSKSPKADKSPKPSKSPSTGADKITFCHATGSTKNPYVMISTSLAGAANGHHGRDHQGGRDIMPAFTYKGVSYAAQGDQSLIGTGCVKPGSTVVQKCPNGQTMPGGNPANCPTTPPVCPKVMPVSGPVMAGCFPTTTNPPTGGGGTPTTGVVTQPATGPAPVRPVPVGPVVPVVKPNNSVNPTVITGPVTLPVERPVPAAAPSTLPFTGADTGLLALLGALLLLAGGALLLAVNLGRQARSMQLS